MSARGARERGGADQAYLRSLPVNEASRVMGSRDRLQKVLGGKNPLEVVNAGRPDGYRITALGDRSAPAAPGTLPPASPERHQAGALAALVGARQAGAQSAVSDAFEEAQRLDGRHHGWYLQQLQSPTVELQRGVRSFERQIVKHEKWIADPASKVADFHSLRDAHREAMIEGWHQDIERHRESIVILLVYSEGAWQ